MNGEKRRQIKESNGSTLGDTALLSITLTINSINCVFQKIIIKCRNVSLKRNPKCKNHLFNLIES